ncbi:sensor histidine kinase [Desulfuribacillus alkaliarsenatis]|uniref:histidine kinase n=1 Tax=Desulfuribacillus alkaliarsenatis TaxID=766136 RepID=A0A1E5G3G4_9FIRM|nr:sensor histidine kinase [Desulfuribacillus alkaliarsenatis]OEF97524.1 hypothetical protein BHF68_04780 [Desulfuribacillus alkaliarsenatis]
MFKELQSYDYMGILRVLGLLIMLSVIYPTNSVAGQVYTLFLALVVITTNTLLLRGLVDTLTKKRIFIAIETILFLILLFFSPNLIYIGLLSVQIITVCIFFSNMWERNIYSILLASVAFIYSLSYSWEYYKTGMTISQIMLELLPYLFFYFVGSAVSKLIQQKEELESLNHKLKESTERVKELAITEERNRLARDIHDTVAHRATGLIMQLQAARSLSKKKRPEELESVIENCLQVSKQMLDEMRRSVRALAPEDTENLLAETTLKQLVDNFSNQTGMKIEVDFYGNRKELSSEQQVTLYRAIQEALTNAKRHGEATEVQIVIKYLASSIEMQIKDNGKGSDNLDYGFGLQAMQQRIMKLHGSLQLDSSNEGVQIVIVIPS